MMMAHPLALQLRTLQSLVEIGVDKNTTVVFPAPLMTTIQEIGAFMAREAHAAEPAPPQDTPAEDATVEETSAVEAPAGAFEVEDDRFVMAGGVSASNGGLS